MTTPEAALADVLMGDADFGPEVQPDCAAHVLEMLRTVGWRLTPLAPEVPPRRDDELRRERYEHSRTIDRRDHAEEMADRLAAALAPEDVLGEHTSLNDPWRNALDYAEDPATPEPPDSGDGAALTGIDAALAEVEAIDPGDFESKASVLVEVRAILRARLRSGSPAPEGGE